MGDDHMQAIRVMVCACNVDDGLKESTFTRTPGRSTWTERGRLSSVAPVMNEVPRVLGEGSR